MIGQGFGKSAGVLAGAAFVLLLNSAYLAASAAPTLFYFTNVIAHIVLGAVLAVVFGRLLMRYRHAIPPALLAASAIAIAGALFGAAITVLGAAGRLRWMLPVHIGLTLLGVVPWVAYGAWFAARRAASTQRLALGVVYGVVSIALLGAPALAWRNGADRGATASSTRRWSPPR